MKDAKRKAFLILPLLVGIFLLFSLPLFSTTYYVKNGGNDGLDGLSDANAWATIAKVEATAGANDTVYFKRGSEWREQLDVPASTMIFGAYGSGADPIINGSDLVSTWTEYSSSGSTWAVALDADSATGTKNTRQVLDSGDLSTDGTEVRIKLEAHSSTDLVIVGTSIAPRSGSSDDFSESPIRITWDTGNNGTTVSAGTTKWSDWVDVSGLSAGKLDSAVDHLVHMNWSSSAIRQKTGAYTHYYDTSGTDYTMIQTWASEGNQGSVRSLTDVEVRTAPPNIWQATCTTEPNQVFFDGTRGTEVASPTLCNGANKWHWATNVLYIYYTEDPDGVVSIEASARNQGISLTDRSYITIDGLEVKRTNTSAIAVMEAVGTPDSVTIQNCNINYAGGHGIIFMAVGGDNLIDNNDISYCLMCGINAYQHVGSTPGHETVCSNNAVHYNGYSGIECHSSYWIVEYCTVHHNGQLSTSYQGITTYADEGDAAIYGDYNIFRYNISYSNSNSGGTANGCGIALDQWCDNNQVYYNITYDNDGTGISAYDGQNNKIYNNVCYGNCQEANRLVRGEILLNGVLTRTQNLIVKNNIGFAITANTYAIYVVADVVGSAGLDIDTNCWYRASGDWYYWDTGSGSNLATWNAFTGVGTDLNSDPLFFDPTDGCLFVKTGSPCLNAGTDLNLTADHDGIAPDASPNIGAYESSYNTTADVFYVSNDGKDSYSGLNTTSPWKTIARVNSSPFTAGDTISLNRGDTWAETLTVPTSGSSGNPITYNAYGTGIIPEIQRFYLASKNYINTENIYFKNASSSACSVVGNTNTINFTNCVFDGNNGGVLYPCVLAGYNGSNWVQNVVFDGCEFKNAGGSLSGLSIEDYSHDVTVKNSLSHDNPDNGIQAWTSDVEASGPYNIIIENTESYDNGNYGIGLSYWVKDSVIRYCKTYNNVTGFGGEASGAGNQYYYNISYGNSQRGAEIDSGHTAANWFNNVFYDNGDHGIYINPGASNGQVIKNNIFFGLSGDSSYMIYVGGTVTITSDYNCFYDTGTNKWHWHGSDYTTFATWKSASSQDANSKNADPLLTSPTTDFTLQSSSPCIDAGVGVGLTQDYAGTTVPQGSAPDIGAYEYESELGIIAIDASGRIIFVKEGQILRAIGRMLIMKDGRILIRIK